MTERQMAQMVDEFRDDLVEIAECYEVAHGTDSPLVKVVRHIILIAYNNLQKPLEMIANDEEAKRG